MARNPLTLLLGGGMRLITWRGILSAIFGTSAFAIVLQSSASGLDGLVAILPPAFAEGIRKQCSRPSAPTGSLFEPTFDQIALAEAALKSGSISKFSCAPVEPVSFYRQYVGIRAAGRGVLYLNAFKFHDHQLDDEFPWKDRPYLVCDGGKRYWGAVFDLGSRKFTEVHFNGELGFGGRCGPAP
jgi:hypothetical protein